MADTKDAVGAFSRRRLLKGSLVGAALLALGGVGLAAWPTRRGAPPSAPLRVLTEDEHAILAAVARRICPEPGPDVPGPDAVEVALKADRLLERADPEAVAGLKSALALFENGLVGALFVERVQPFTHLDEGQQDGVLVAWRDSSVALRRTVFRALASLTGSIYYGDPATWPGIGYGGPPDRAALRAAYADNLVDQRALAAPGDGPWEPPL